MAKSYENWFHAEYSLRVIDQDRRVTILYFWLERIQDDNSNVRLRTFIIANEKC